MRFLLPLFAALCLSFNAGAEPARLVVMSAFGPELEALKAASTDTTVTRLNGTDFTLGTLDGKPVILVLSGVSMVNAAMTTQLMLDHFKIDRIVFSGVGGGVDPTLDVGDVVVPERWGEYQENRFARETASGFQGGGDGTGLPAFGMMIPRGVTVPAPKGGVERKTWFEVDPAMLAVARAQASQTMLSRCAGTACLDKSPKVVVGGNGVSGPTFVDNAAYRDYAFRAFQARVLDMETAAVAHVAYVNRTPFIAFRALSDLAGGDPAGNQFPIFIRLAADNSARVVRDFLKALPA
ncbi:MAG: phosphorylase [Phenylobacterium zucineum]|nr:MAG: phosphorylase [Phenylobacterium zucineum]